MTNNNQGLQPNVFYTIATEDIPKFVEGIVKEYLAKTQEAEAKPVEGKDAGLMTRQEVAEYLGVTMATLSNWAKLDYLPCIHIGRGVRYRRADVIAFAASHKNK